MDSGTYKGNWLYNRRHGEGTMTWNDGSEFDGTWRNDKRFKGTMRMTDGTVYSGEWRDGEELHGLGRIIYPDGLIFEGQFRNNCAPDWGRILYPGEDEVYEGELDDLKRHGIGEMRYANGTVY